MEIYIQYNAKTMAEMKLQKTRETHVVPVYIGGKMAVAARGYGFRLAPCSASVLPVGIHEVGEGE
jgi:hypothetical protein